jgi:hypothetical protein
VPAAGAVDVRITVSDCAGSSPCTTAFTLTGSGATPPTGADQLVLSEIHADPDPTIAGDANGDGTRDGTEDEFVELVNITAGSLDLSGVTIADAVTVRHTFPPGTIVPSGGAVVVFGGGTPTGSFGGSVVQVASGGMLGFNNTGDTVTVSNAGAVQLDQHTYGSEGGNDEALLKDPEPDSAVPSAGGPGWVLHSLGPGPGLIFSPGTKADGVTSVW